MRDAGLYAEALSDWNADAHEAAGGLLINFTNVASRETAEQLAARIKALL